MADPQPPAGYTLDAPPPPGYTVDAPTSIQPDIFERAVNYRSGDPRVDLPLGVIQGVAKGAASTGAGIGSLYRKLAGLPPLPEGTFASDVTPNAPGQGTGKFLEQAAEYAVPAGEVGKALEAAPLAARLAAQAGVGGAVSGLQSGGDPTAIGIGAGLGAGGELAGTAVRNILAARSLPKAATLENFRDSFGAVPTQLPVIKKAMQTLAADGVAPQASVPEMHAALDAKIADLGTQYAAQDAAGVGAKTIDVDRVISDLKQQQQAYTHDGKVVSANQPQFDKITQQIQDVQDLSKDGQISFAALRHLRDAANGRTNFTSPQAEEDLYRGIGNAYRGAMDEIDPGTADLNRKYATYTQLQKIAARNSDMGRGTLPSRFEQGIQRATSPTTGAIVGGQVGAGIAHSLGLPIWMGEGAGGLAGSVLYPKLAQPVAEALQNSVQNGQFQKLAPGAKQLVNWAAQRGDSATVTRLLQSATAAGVQNVRNGTNIVLPTTP